MPITGLDALTYGVEDMELCRRFFADWGLTEIDPPDGTPGDAVLFETLDGSTVTLRPLDTADLPPAFEPGPTLREAVWGVETDADLDALRRRLGCDALEPVTTDPTGLALRFRVSRRRPVTVTGSPDNTIDHAARIDRPSPVYDRAQPVRIGHVVLFVPDLDAATAFYADALGFVLSDSYPGHGAFLRCQPRGGHHNLFLLKSPGGKAGLNHVAFTVRDIHEVFGGGLAISRAGWETQIGPGRHPISSAYFWYVRNPAGGLAEYYSNEDVLTENWQPRAFERSPALFAEWAVAGGLDGNTRRQAATKD